MEEEEDEEEEEEGEEGNRVLRKVAILPAKVFPHRVSNSFLLLDEKIANLFFLRWERLDEKMC